jgi:hypothetical protein
VGYWVDLERRERGRQVYYLKGDLTFFSFSLFFDCLVLLVGVLIQKLTRKNRPQPIFLSFCEGN